MNTIGSGASDSWDGPIAPTVAEAVAYLREVNAKWVKIHASIWDEKAGGRGLIEFGPYTLDAFNRVESNLDSLNRKYGKPGAINAGNVATVWPLIAEIDKQTSFWAGHTRDWNQKQTDTGRPILIALGCFAAAAVIAGMIKK